MLADSLARRIVEPSLLRGGVSVNGPQPWDPQIRDPRFYLRLLTQGSLGLGESYVDGWWECAQIDELVARLLRSSVDHGTVDVRKLLLRAQGQLMNLQTTARASQVAEAHYDLGNPFFEAMLGPSMNYSCGYWHKAKDLDAAQEAKMDLICRKLQLAPGQRLLDIGSGWGALGCFAAANYGVSVVGVTVSPPQRDYAQARGRGLPVEFLLADYRSDEILRRGPFDKIVSVGMFEHVGRRNYPTFFRTAHRLLRERDDALFLLHTIGNDHSPTDAWLNRYIFPNGELPSTQDLTAAARGLFVLEDWHNFRADYDRTILGWHKNFERFAQTTELPPRFYRMWRYYLLIMAGSFRAQSRNQLWQLVFSRRGLAGGYRSIR